jgi:hypothetical protein
VNYDPLLERIEAEIAARKAEIKKKNVGLLPDAGLIAEIIEPLTDDEGSRAQLAGALAMLLSDPDPEKAVALLAENGIEAEADELKALTESEVYASFQALVSAEPDHKDFCAAAGELLETEIDALRCKSARYAERYAEFIRRVAKAQQTQRGWDDHNGVRQGGLIAFVRYFWSVLEPETPFVDGWPLWAMVLHLESVTAGEITRLLINFSGWDEIAFDRCLLAGSRVGADGVVALSLSDILLLGALDGTRQ